MRQPASSEYSPARIQGLRDEEKDHSDGFSQNAHCSGANAEHSSEWRGNRFDPLTDVFCKRSSEEEKDSCKYVGEVGRMPNVKQWFPDLREYLATGLEVIYALGVLIVALALLVFAVRYLLSVFS